MIYELAGWSGALFVLSAYFLVSARKVTPVSKTFHILNLFGALGIIVNNISHQAIPGATLNLIWAGIAIWGLWNALKK